MDNITNNTSLNPDVWGPHYWFFMNTIAVNYPKNPSDGIKKKHYNFITSLIDFIPNASISKEFENMLDQYPIEPYLNSRDSLLKWVHFIHNKVNERIGKKTITYYEFIESYYAQYKPKDLQLRERRREREKMLYTIVTFTSALLLVYLLRSE